MLVSEQLLTAGTTARFHTRSGWLGAECADGRITLDFPAVVESARNVACTGARPVAVTNCLNFGDPTNPDVMWQFAEAVRGIGDACRRLGTPVTGGNVSFYNETNTAAIYPTPVIGMLGVLDDAGRAVRLGLRRDGDTLILLGRTAPGDFGGSDQKDRSCRLVKFT